MRSTFAPLALAALVAANPVPQGVTAEIRPQSSPPAGCSENYSGQFAIQIVNATTSTKRSLTKRAQTLMVTLAGGVLKDDKDRTGYIAANNQFQFDSPPQTGAKYTAGFSVCGNGSLALGDDAIWYACASGGFFNLYDMNSADQCSMVYIETVKTGSTGSGEQSDGQPTGTVATSAAVSQISDAQPQAPTAVTSAVSQISDGQIQATSAMTAAPVSQISDGQIQATTAAASQISDGQVQASPVSTAMAASQISDGQVQATPVSPVSQISDGQIQATGAVYPSGNSTMAPYPSASVQPQIGAASAVSISTAFAVVAGVVAVFML